MAPFVTNHGFLPLNGGLWIHIDLPNGTRFGVAAIYAPNTTAERTQLWTALESTLDSDRKWLFAGDYNMITNTLGQVGGTPQTIAGEEKESWITLTQILDLHDTFKRKEEAFKYSWNNKRQALLQSQDPQQPQTPVDGGRILKRLDRIYADSSFLQTPYSSTILAGSEIERPSPGHCGFHLHQNYNSKKTNYRMNVAALRDPILKDNLKKLWALWEKKYEDNSMPALQALKSCIKCTANEFLFLRLRPIYYLIDQSSLKIRPEASSGLNGNKPLQADPANMYTQLKLEAAQNDLMINTWETEKARWLQQHMDKTWEEEGERASKLFFSFLKARKKQTNVHAIRDEEGILHSSEKEILDLVVDYLSEILHEPQATHHQDLETYDLLSKIQVQVTASKHKELQKNFTIDELHKAAKLLDKCPGPDGVPLEFFLSLWETICHLLCRDTTEGLQQDTLTPFFNREVITLLQKDADVTLLKNKRPITLLNAVYKIWVKALQLRLSPILQHIIMWEQNAFISGRYLHSTVFMCNEAIFEAKRQNQDSLLLKINFRKALDTLRWNFLYKAMTKMKFGQHLISLVATLNNEASSCIRVRILQGYFADDSHLLLSAEKQNLQNAKTLLNSFANASGLIVQWEKSKAKWISTTNTPPDWLQELDWVWEQLDHTDKLLGFYFTVCLDEEAIFQAAMQKNLSKINMLSSRSTSIHGRIITNHLIYGVLWFILPLWTRGKAKIRQIETTILKYVWGGKDTTNRRHRVTETILHQRKKDGGLGLMSIHIQAQAQAFIAKMIRWSFTPGAHPLKLGLLDKFQVTTIHRWSSNLYTWITSPSKGVWPGLSPLMLHTCKMWQAASRLLAPITATPMEKAITVGTKNIGSPQHNKVGS
ncbi:hypothetical protein R1sor_013432 [Riccia sorocarpa]|uniref:Reverse transcriptase domain-containing protein n=1 Tax=Riccia sorocarpa TaxID=122646 RepID=A0ABD3H6J2_9MARC